MPTVRAHCQIYTSGKQMRYPKMVAFSGDSGTEKLAFTAWEMWVH